MEKKKLFPILLLDWFKKNKRSFLWRKTSDPYSIIIAEIMLQRTKANQVEPVLRKFLDEFPTIKELNSAKEKALQ